MRVGFSGAVGVAFCIGAAATVGLALAIPAWIMLARKSAGGLMLAVVAAVLLSFGAAVVALLRISAVRKQARANEGRLCLRCWYVLPLEPESGSCPECGAGYRLCENAAAWGVGAPGPAGPR